MRGAWISGCGVWTIVFGAAALVGCGRSNLASQLAKPPEWKPGQHKCGIIKSKARPLVVEWPSAERGRLEALTKHGVVAVRYEGCEMEILPDCKVGGIYSYTSFARKDDRLSVKNADELYAKLPLGAARFEGELKSAGSLDVTMSMVGEFRSNQSMVRAEDLPSHEICKTATHVVTAYTVGAFEFASGASANVGGSASHMLGTAVGGDSKHAVTTLAKDGSLKACAIPSADGMSPPAECGAILRVEVTKLGREASKSDAVNPGAAHDAAIDEDSSHIGLAVRCPIGEDETQKLKVTVDGKEMRLGTRATGFAVTPKDHRIAISAQDCAAHELSLSPAAWTHTDIEGELTPSFSAKLRNFTGPVTSALTQLAVGYAQTSLGPSVEYATGRGQPLLIADGATLHGAAFGAVLTPRFMRIGFEARVTGGEGFAIASPGATATADMLIFDQSFKIGPRIPFVYGAFAIGTGIRGSFVSTSSPLGDKSVYAASLPLWAELEARPTCSFGVRLLGGPDIGIGRMASSQTPLSFFSTQIQVEYAFANSWECAGDRGTLVTGEPRPIPKPEISETEEIGDRDNDGIPDHLDKCPDEPEDMDGFEDEDGCPDLDNDKDGIPDAQDKCPDEAGVWENDGCPRTPIMLTQSGIQSDRPFAFDRDDAVVRGPLASQLMRVVELLKESPDVKILVEGHADPGEQGGSAEAQARLSETRADAVRVYLQDHGVDAIRLRARGYGSTQPLDASGTDLGRARNRRVILVRVN